MKTFIMEERKAGLTRDAKIVWREMAARTTSVRESISLHPDTRARLLDALKPLRMASLYAISMGLADGHCTYSYKRYRAEIAEFWAIAYGFGPEVSIIETCKHMAKNLDHTVRKAVAR